MDNQIQIHMKLFNNQSQFTSTVCDTHTKKNLSQFHVMLEWKFPPPPPPTPQ